MKKRNPNRRAFMKQSVTSAAGLLTISALSKGSETIRAIPSVGRNFTTMQAAPRLKFSVIGINHDHIHGQIGATIRGGGEFVSFYAKEPDLAAAFAKRYPQVKQARSQDEILEDKSTPVSYTHLTLPTSDLV